MRMDESTLYRGQWRDGRPHGLGAFEVRRPWVCESAHTHCIYALTYARTRWDIARFAPQPI